MPPPGFRRQPSRTRGRCRTPRRCSEYRYADRLYWSGHHGRQHGFEPAKGGPSGAKSGRLAIWVGGDKAVFDEHKDKLDAIGDQAMYVGPIGAGCVTKLVHNCAGYMIQTALAEVFSLGVKAGVDPLDLWAAVRQGAVGRTRTFDRLLTQFLPGQFDPPSFALRLAHKDVTLATELARELHVPMR